MGAVIVIMMKENSDPLSIVLVKNFKKFPCAQNDSKCNLITLNANVGTIASDIINNDKIIRNMRINTTIIKITINKN